MTKEELQQAIEVAKKNLAAAETALADFISAPENNVFDSLEDAVETIENRLRGQAGEDCEGSYNCGSDEYEQEFIVNGIRYLGTLQCEYNRHDKTYYYLDGAEFTYKVLDDEGQG
jgi:hypothetical protein